MLELGDITLEVFKRLRDQVILQAISDVDAVVRRVLSHPDFLYLTKLDFTDEEVRELKSDPEIDFPLIYTEIARLGSERGYASDPRLSDNKITLSEYLKHWCAFVMLNLQNNGEHARHLIARGILSVRHQYGKEAAQTFVDRLWEHRWIFGYAWCGQFRLLASAETEEGLREIWARCSSSTNKDPSPSRETKESPKRVETDEEKALGTFKGAEAKLERVKSEVTDLNSWLEGVFLVSPILSQAKQLLQKIDTLDARKYLRLIEEWMADISGALFLRLTLYRIFLKQRNIFTEILPDRRQDVNIRSVQRELSYYCRARVLYPQFWLKAALKWLETGNAQVPPQLDEFNDTHLVSLLICYSPNKAHEYFESFSPEGSKSG
jgi:hypothetical protein